MKRGLPCRVFLVLCALLLALWRGPSVQAETAVPPVLPIPGDGGRPVSLTVYPDDLALVRERREIQAAMGLARLVWPELSARVLPESAVLRRVEPVDRLVVMEQSFSLQRLTPEALLAANLGKTIRLVRTHPTTGAETEEPAVLLSVDGGVIVRVGDRVETVPPGRIAFDRIPEGLSTVPSLSLLVDNQVESRQVLELAYLTAGLGWRADYVAWLNREQNMLSVKAWATVTNRSGRSYGQASLGLVAGQVHRATPSPGATMAVMRSAEAADAGVSPTRRILGDYHLYALERLVSLPDGGSRQFALFPEASLAVEKVYRIEGQERYFRAGPVPAAQPVPVSVWLEGENTGREGAQPLPAGTVRVYGDDGTGESRFLGSDTLDPTPVGGRLSLQTGFAFDVTATRRQTEYRKLGTVGQYRQAHASRYEITIRNAGNRAVAVQVQESFPGEWDIAEESLAHEKISAHRAQWRVPVPPGGEAVLRYAVTVRY